MRAPDPESVKAAADRAEARADGRSERRSGRGHLTSFDLLPEEAQEDVAWARAQLSDKKRTQEDIRFEFNGRLAAKGVEPMSKSAFNRVAVRLAALNNRIAKWRQINDVLMPQFTAERVDENTIALGEFLKLVVFELAEEGQDIGTKGAMELARAHLAVIQGQAISAQRRAKLEASFKEEAAKAIDRAAKAKGLSQEARLAMRAELFGQPVSEAPRGA